MVQPRTLLALALAAPLLAPRAAIACDGARAGAMAEEAPASFREAVGALLASTREPGAPWGCVASTVDVVARPGGLSLAVVAADGRRVEREVESADEIVPLGQALLAMPLPPIAELPLSVVDPGPATGTAPIAEDAIRAPVAEADERDPRVRVGVVAAPRYAGSADVTWGGVAIDAAIPFGGWAFGVYGRADALIIDAPRDNPTLTEIAAGLEIRRGWEIGPVILEPAVRPSIALLSRDEGQDGGDTQLNARIGGAVRLIVPFSSTIRGVALADAEIAPGELDGGRGGGGGNGPDNDGQPRKPSFPSYTLGLGLGVEIAIR